MNETIKQLQQLSQPKYQILELVGQGQFGRVYRAVHKASGQVFALKELDKNVFLLTNFCEKCIF